MTKIKEAIKTIFSDLVEFFKMQIEYERTCREIEKHLRENFTYEKRTGKWQRKKWQNNL